MSSLNELRSKVKGLSAYPSIAKPNTLGSYGKNFNMPTPAADDYRTFDYQEFAKQNNINMGGQSQLPKGGSNGNAYNPTEKPKAQKEFENEFFKMFSNNRR